MRVTYLAAAFATLVMTTGVQAQQGAFHPTQNCVRLLNDPSAQNNAVIAAWALGYIAARSENVWGVNAEATEALVKNLKTACAARPEDDLITVLAANTKPAEKPATQPTAKPGSEADARLLVSRFLDPTEDLHALTQSILPTEAEVKMVYADPLASAMWTEYARMMTPALRLGPKAEHDHFLVTYSTTGALAGPDGAEFPGGYRKVLPYFKIDVPIVRFKFVEQGKTLGLSFDGLIYVNNRWVLMPKPWRSLP